MNNLITVLTQSVPEGRVFGLDSQTLISIGIQLFNGIVLAIALTLILYKPVKEFLRKRAERIQADIDNAEATMTEATALINEYEGKLKDINQERLEILEKARNKARAENKLIIEEAEKEAEDIKQRTLVSIEEDKKRLQEEMRLQVIDLSSLVAEKYLTMNLDEETQGQYLDKVINQLEKTQ